MQKNLFIKNNYFIPIGSNKSGKTEKFWREAGIARNKPTSACDFAGVSRRLDAKLADAVASNRRVVVSDEGVTSIGSTLTHQDLTVERLLKVSSTPVVLLVLRSQQDLLRSRYRQHKVWKQWATLGLATHPDTGRNVSEVYSVTSPRVLRFDRWVRYGINTQDGNWFSNLNYFDLYRAYADRLGEGRVHVLFYEDLVARPQDFARALGRALDLDTRIILEAIEGRYNISARNSRSRLLKSRHGGGLGLSNVLRLKLHQLSGAGGLDPVISPTLSEMVSRAWGDQNRRLAEALGVDLAAMGYPV